MKNITRIKYLLFMVMFIIAISASGQSTKSDLLPEANRDFSFDYQDIQPIKFESFAAAAEWADVVAVAQVINVDYEQTRDINTKGQAFLNVLVPYKGTQRNELLIVSSKGFDDHVCYYPDRDGEGERFLVFLKAANSDGEYHGFNPYCQLQVLLTDTGEFALRYPLDIDFALAPESIRTLNFNDPHSQIDATEWTGLARAAHQQKYQSTLEEDEDTFQKYYFLNYTQGVMIYEIRKLMNLKVQPRISSKQM
ncbi:hypothetical protein OS175_11120 [Marinicella sp. S1101]|uniref:hypothetical protein n=1 Tax=Marinicella marina TaxID=2996016 RepID=UPI002260C55A|nr:hypothetical protein [Marinicella marina]MCX7554434.1 hypothetical protein [Marinicella marina]MDJ1140585.1 hypothetical protein [Marinicella marina]